MSSTVDLSLEMTSPALNSAPGLGNPEKNKRGTLREYQANLTLCLGILVNGMGYGFSAMAIPNIILENVSAMNTTTQVMDSPLIPIVLASRDQLSWFGE